MPVLNLNKIIANTEHKYHKYLTAESIIIFDQIDSTNSYLLKCSKLKNNKLRFCLAEKQTSGRGRLNRTWHSPAGNIYLSIFWSFNLKVQQLAGLNIAIALAVNRALINYGAKDLFLKWPNDILYQNAKLAGILIESIAKTKKTLVIIGTGINILANQQSINSNLLSAPTQNLQNIIQKLPDRNVLIGMIFNEILNTLHNFSGQGLDLKLIDEWKNYSYKLDQKINIKVGPQIIQGLNRGIDQQGNLLIDPEISNPISSQINCKRIKLRTINSGEIIIENL